MLDFDSYSVKATGKRLQLIEQVRMIPDIPKRACLEVTLLTMNYRLYFLSLFLGTRVQLFQPVTEGERLVMGFLVDKDVEASELTEFDKTFDKMLHMPRDSLEGYLNSCSAFHSALTLSESNYTVAFVLLVIAVESLSNREYPKSHGHLKRGFKKFVRHYLLADRAFLPFDLKRALNGEQEDTLLRRLLESVYSEIRSGFVHHGRGDPIGSILADRAGLAYIRIGEDPQLSEKEQHKFLNPGLGWFKRIVREVLLEFLQQESR